MFSTPSYIIDARARAHDAYASCIDVEANELLVELVSALRGAVLACQPHELGAELNRVCKSWDGREGRYVRVSVVDTMDIYVEDGIAENRAQLRADLMDVIHDAVTIRSLDWEDDWPDISWTRAFQDAWPEAAQ